MSAPGRRVGIVICAVAVSVLIVVEALLAALCAAWDELVVGFYALWKIVKEDW